MYTLVKRDSRRTDGNRLCRRELTVRPLSREFLGGWLVHGYQGCGERLLVGSMSCLVDVRVYRPGFRGL